MGTPEFAVGSLQRLVEGGYNVVAVVTQPDKPVGRHGSVLRAPAVKEYALAHNLPVLQPVKMKDPAFVEELRSYNADLQVVVAFRMLPEIVWAMPRFGTFNVHAALLPGRIIMQKEFSIPDNADVEYVYNGLMALGADICIETVDAVINNDGNVPSQPQREDLPLKSAPKLFKETCLINWNKEAKQVYDFVRGLSPVPGAWCEIVHNDEKPVVMKIFRTAKTDKPLTAKDQPGDICAEGQHLLIAAADKWLEIVELQLAGKKRMMAKDFLNGYDIKGKRIVLNVEC